MTHQRLEQRKPIANYEIDDAINVLVSNIEQRIDKFGDSSHVSKHESFGIIAEEMHELLLAVHGNDLDNAQQECMDIAVACIWGYLSMQKMKTDTTTQ